MEDVPRGVLTEPASPQPQPEPRWTSGFYLLVEYMCVGGGGAVSNPALHSRNIENMVNPRTADWRVKQHVKERLQVVQKLWMHAQYSR